MRNPKDFWAGLLFLGIGGAFIAVALAGGYELGSARRMGPGYFPVWLGGGLSLTGLMLAWRGLATSGAPIGRWALMPLGLVTLGTILFGLIVNVAGLAPAIVVLVLLAAFASIHFRVSQAIALAVGLAAISVLVFIKGLGITVPVMPHVLGY